MARPRKDAPREYRATCPVCLTEHTYRTRQEEMRAAITWLTRLAAEVKASLDWLSWTAEDPRKRTR